MDLVMEELTNCPSPHESALLLSFQGTECEK